MSKYNGIKCPVCGIPWEDHWPPAADAWAACCLPRPRPKIVLELAEAKATFEPAANGKHLNGKHKRKVAR